MSTLDELTTCTPVLFMVGYLDNNRPKIIPAPFQIINMPSNEEDTTRRETYVSLVPIYSDVSAADPMFADDDLGDGLFLSRGTFGYQTDPITIEPHQMGDLQDTIFGLNYFSFV